jgi:hypothetical protein
MKKILAAVAVLTVALLVPTGVMAKPDQSEKRMAKAECKAERGKSEATREAFGTKYRGFRDCVRKKAKAEEAQNETARGNAAKECKAEGLTGREYGKCVSTRAKAKKAEMDAKDAEEAEEFRNAAKECAAERKDMGDEDFADEYGTNENGENAFGKCVSRKVRES